MKVTIWCSNIHFQNPLLEIPKDGRFPRLSQVLKSPHQILPIQSRDKHHADYQLSMQKSWLNADLAAGRWNRCHAGQPRRNCRGTSIGLRRSLANSWSPLPGESSSIQLATGKKVAVLSVVAIRVKKRPGHTYWRIYREGWTRSAKEKQRKIERERASERESASRRARAEEKEKEKEKEKQRHCELERKSGEESEEKEEVELDTRTLENGR